MPSFLQSTAVAFLTCFALSAQAAIVESNSIETIANQADADTLVLANLTDTLYTSENTMGDSLWKDKYFGDRVRALIPNQEKAEAIINSTKNKIVNAVPKVLVEPVTAQVIQSLQSRRIPVLGLTMKRLSTPYEKDFAALVNKYLTGLGIHLDASEPLLAATVKMSPEYNYSNGIIFTSKQSKGEALKTFLNNINGTKPKKVLSIDINLDNLKEEEKALDGMPVAFSGFHYVRDEARKNNFDPDLGTIEFLEFLSSGQVMNDQEAMQMKHHNPSHDYAKDLDEAILKM